VYNTLTQQKAFIDDYYEIGLPVGAGAAENIQWKFNATTAHVGNATMLSFASSEHDEDVPPETPRVRPFLESLG
jgi:1-phosphatidylinositol phosphodiesterase